MFNNVKNQTYAERENVLSMYVSSLDTAAEQMTTALYRLSSEYDMLLLMQSDAKTVQTLLSGTVPGRVCKTLTVSGFGITLDEWCIFVL